MLVEAGVTYSSSMRGDDRPYLVNVPGFETPLVEIPGRWEMDDYASLAYTRAPDFPSGLDRTASYELTLDNWCREYDGAMNEGLCLTTLFHPKITGKPGRILLLEKLFEHMRQRDDGVVRHLPRRRPVVAEGASPWLIPTSGLTAIAARWC